MKWQSADTFHIWDICVKKILKIVVSRFKKEKIVVNYESRVRGKRLKHILQKVFPERVRKSLLSKNWQQSSAFIFVSESNNGEKRFRKFGLSYLMIFSYLKYWQKSHVAFLPKNFYMSVAIRSEKTFLDRPKCVAKPILWLLSENNVSFFFEGNVNKQKPFASYISQSEKTFINTRFCC